MPPLYAHMLDPSRHHQAMGPWRQRHLSYREKSLPPQPFDLVRASQWIR